MFYMAKITEAYLAEIIYRNSILRQYKYVHSGRNLVMCIDQMYLSSHCSENKK